MNVSEFFAMGGYGFYVWTAYGLAVLALVLNLIVPLKHRHSVRRQLADFHRLRGERE